MKNIFNHNGIRIRYFEIAVFYVNILKLFIQNLKTEIFYKEILEIFTFRWPFVECGEL